MCVNFNTFGSTENFLSGYSDSNGSNAGSNGVFFYKDTNTTIRGFAYLAGQWLPEFSGYIPACVTASGAGAQTATAFTPTINTWYTLQLTISMGFSSGSVSVADLEIITFAVSTSDGTVVWTDSITATTTGVNPSYYIPNTANPVKCQISGWSTSGTNTPYFTLDYMLSNITNIVR